MRQSLAIWEKVLGERHPNTATCYDRVGLCLRQQGKPQEALLLHRKAQAIREKTLGPELLKLFHIHGLLSGLVVDLGCGSGQWLAQAASAPRLGHSLVARRKGPQRLRSDHRTRRSAQLCCRRNRSAAPGLAISSRRFPVRYQCGRREAQTQRQSHLEEQSRVLDLRARSRPGAVRLPEPLDRRA